MCDYHDQTYWHDRYTGDCEPFEWYVDFTALRPIISNIINDYLITVERSLEIAVPKKAKSTQMRTRSISHQLNGAEDAASKQLRPRGASMIQIDERTKNRALIRHRLQILEIGCGSSELAHNLSQVYSDRARSTKMQPTEAIYLAFRSSKARSPRMKHPSI
jgi:hypothetical protein